MSYGINQQVGVKAQRLSGEGIFIPLAGEFDQIVPIKTL
jgi:hypothetical protein